MVKLLVGHKGSGKTKQMIDMANDEMAACDGHIVFINKEYRASYDLSHDIREIFMDDYPHITNSDEYIGFIYGIMSSDHDIETMYIDGLLKYADVTLGNLPEFIERIKKISAQYGPNFVVSLSAAREEMIGVDFSGCEVVE